MDRFYVIAFILFFMWFGIMALFYLKADEVTKNPCQVCAKKVGEDVRCTTFQEGEPQTIIFHPDMSVELENVSNRVLP